MFRPRLGLVVLVVFGVAVWLVAEAAVAAPQTSSGPDRFTVQSDGHPMAVWARRPASPKGTVLLVHGRTWSSRPDFDLQVSGLRRSVLADLAAQGYAAYAVDLRGYGETPRDDSGWLTPKRAASDVSNVLTWVSQQNPTLPKPALVGWSRGAPISMLAVQLAPTRVSAVVLFGFAYDPDLQFVDDVTPDAPEAAKNTRASASSDFISPKVTSPAVISAFVDQAMRSDPVTADLKDDSDFNGIDTPHFNVPTLVLFGERDPGLTMDVAGKFFARLGTPDKQMVVLPGADHAAQLEDTHDAWIAAVVNFLNRPPVRR